MRRDKGSIAIFVLAALLFMSGFLLILYASNVNKSKTVKEQLNIISDIYAYNGGEEGAYEKAYTDLRKKNTRLFSYENESDADKTIFENTSAVELTKTFNENIINYKIYGNSVQNGTPTLDNPVGVQSVGDLVTDTSDSNKIPIKLTNENGESETKNIYLDEPLRKIGNYADYIDFKTGKVVRNIGKIESYNGETITTSWISETGELSAGAIVYYVLEIPREETVTLLQLKTFEDYTKIEVLTNITPSKIEMEYVGYTLD